MSKKPDLFSIRVDLKAIFKKKIRTGFQKLKSGKWRMDLSCNRIRLNFKSWWTKTASPRSFRIFKSKFFSKTAHFEFDTIVFGPRITMVAKTKQWPIQETSHAASFETGLGASASSSNTCPMSTRTQSYPSNLYLEFEMVFRFAELNNCHFLHINSTLYSQEFSSI